MTLKKYIRYVFDKNREKVALQYYDKQYTYGQLDSISDRIAQNIKKLGVKSGTRIGVFINRNANAIFTIFGIIKANCVYAPLSKENPQLRTERMIDVADINIVISDEKRFSYEKCVIVQYEDLLIECNEQMSDEQEEVDVLYTIFTSGTTGFPKAFDIKKEGIVNLIASMDTTYFNEESDSYDVIGELAELVFDVSQGQIYLALLNGKVLNIIPGDVKRNPRMLRDYLEEKKIKQCDITPTLLKVLYDYAERNKTKIRYPLIWSTSGEKIPMELARLVVRHDNTKIANSYGPAETCVYVSIYIFDKLNVELYGSVTPIGKPIFNTKICIVDSNGNKMAPNEEGEIAVCGVGVMDGYINNPEVNKKVFFTDEKGDSYYRTGDLGYLCSEDDLLYCLGRIDHQVKYHGIRVELDEIRWGLNEMDGIDDCYPFVHKTENGSDLVVYYKSEIIQDLSAMGNHLSKYLPASLLPNYYVKVEEFPTSVSGKINVSAFPPYKTGCEEIEEEKKYEDKKEEEFINLLKEILVCAKLSLEEDFYMVGGDSIDFINFLSRIESLWKIDIAYDEFVKCHNLREMLCYLRSCKKNEDVENNNEVYESDCLSKVKMQPFQCDIVNAEDPESNYPTHNIINMIILSENLDVDRLKSVVEEEVRQQEALRSSIVKTEMGYELHLNEDIDGCFEYVRCVSIDDDLKRYVKNIPYDSNTLIKFMLFEDDYGKQKIVINAHHSIFDYMSVTIFIRHVINRYFDYKVNRIDSYYHYISSGSSEEYKMKKKDFWRNYYAGRDKAVIFPIEKKDSASDGFGRVELMIDGGQINMLREKAKSHSVTLFHVIIGLWAQLLQEYTKKNDFIFGTFFPGRNSNYADTVGLFSNCLGLRIRLNEENSLYQIFNKVKESCMQINKFQDSDLRELFSYMQMHDLFKGELFGIMINYLSDLSFSLNFDEKKIDISIYDISCEPDSHTNNISIYEFKNYLKIVFSYDNAKYNKDYIEKILSKYKLLIDELCY